MVLTLMSFIVLLTLSLAVMLKVEIDSSQSRTLPASAEANALLGLRIAIGHLQKTMGEDQRVSARAEILDTDPANATGAAGVTQPLWTGVWQQADSSSTSGLPEGIDPRAKSELVSWLVSGNGKEIEFSPTEVLPDNSITMVSQIDAVEEIGNPATPSFKVPFLRTENGGYAYAVIDEGVKAKLNSVSENLEEEEPPLLPLSNGASAYEAFRFSPQAAGDTWRKLVDMEFLFEDSMGDIRKRSRILSQSATLSHNAVLTDTLRGGLQLDLSPAFRMDKDTFKRAVIDSHLLHDEIYRPYHPTKRGGGPSWDIFRQFAKLNEKGQSNQFNLTATDIANEEIGIYPVLERFQLHIVVRVASSVDPAKPDFYNFRPRIYYLPAVTLWNPYDKAIVADKGLTVRWRRQNKTQDDWRYLFSAGYYDNAKWKEILINGSKVAEFPVFYEKASGANERFVDFELSNETGGDQIVIPPGESRIFTMKTNQEYSPSKSQTVTMRQGWGTFGFYQDSPNLITMDASSFSGVPPSLFLDIRTPQNVATGNVLDNESNFLLLNKNKKQYSEYRNLRWKYYDANGDEQNTGLLTGKDTVTELPSHFFGDDNNGPSPIEVFSFETSSSLHFRGLPGNNQPAHEDGLDVSVIGYELGLKTINPQVAETYPQIRDSASLLHRYNIRANHSNTVPGKKINSLGTYHFINRQYYFVTVVENSEINIPGSQFGYQVANENFKIETWNGDQSSFLGYSDTPEGSNKFVLFRLPDDDDEILSIGDFRHLDLRSGEPDELQANGSGEWDSTNFGPSFIVGEAHANYHLPSTDYTDQDFVPDYQWIINRQLWDRFFVSTIPDTSDYDFPLKNGKLKFIGSSLNEDTREELSSVSKSASQLLIDGAFNINSTSVQAWEALFSQFFGRKAGNVEVADGAFFLDIPEPDTLFKPENSGVGPSTPNSGWSSDKDAWTGMRVLSQAEIQRLAEKMVEEVKLRGPFLSLSGFVNRSIIDDPDANLFTNSGSELNGSIPGLSDLAKDPRIFGALQAAIEKAGLNSGFEDYIIDSLDDVPLSDEKLYGFRAAGLGSYAEGISGYLTQGKLLNRLGPILRPRSDTFTVRSYGNVRNPVTNELSAEAYCEAVLQRLPEYVDTSDSPEIHPNDLTSPANQSFGRRFKIVSFRWLQPDEI